MAGPQAGAEASSRAVWTRTEFAYDGLGRRAQIIERTAGAITSVQNFVYDGWNLAEQRDASNTPQRRYFAQGEQRETSADSGNYFYTFDHLGSVRELLDNSGTVRARYDYDLWGNRTKVSGDLDCDFGFTSYWFHPPSGLHLSPTRLYSSAFGRFLSPDPIGERGGMNLYGYVGNDPVNAVDPLGLDAEIDVYRTSLTSSASVMVFENGRYLGGSFGNLSGFSGKTRGPSDSIYELLPKDNYAKGDAYLNGTPSITKDGLLPGQPAASSRPTFRVHPEGRSEGCLTVPREWADRIWDVMLRNEKSGGTRLRYVTQSDPRAVLIGPTLQPPTKHTWPISGNAYVYLRGGGTKTYPASTFDAQNQTYGPNFMGQTILAKVSAYTYEERFPDGSKDVYNLADSANHIFLRQVVDPQGNA
jgi:RHS repeat-associated protein